MSPQESFHGGQLNHISVYILPWVSPQKKKIGPKKTDFLNKASKSPASNKTKTYTVPKKERGGELSRDSNFAAVEKVQLGSNL